MLRSENAASGGQPFFQERLRFVRGTETLINPSHHGQHLGLQLGLARELLLNALGPRIEDPSHSGLFRFAIGERVRASKESRQKLTHFRGLLRLEPSPRSRSAASRAV